MVKSAIKVYARVRPEKSRKNTVKYQIHHRPKENIEEDYFILVPLQKVKEFLDHRPESWNFSFSRIFEDSATQEDIFENVARPVVESVLDGYNGTIFAYGQTGSGKTYTITGDQKKYDARGIIPRSLQYLFEVIRKHPENVYSVEVAYLEIYNENGYDLLDRKQRGEFAVTRLEDLPRVAIQEDEIGKLHLKNLTFHCIGNEQDAFELLLVGDNNRMTADTPMNPQSSRSHCIFTIMVSTKQFGADHYTRAKIHLVDLAGSERVYKCAISGTILTEAKHINLSLHYLEQVIVCLGQESAGHIPYRNSFLTAVLRDSLGGNCLTTMLATLSVSTSNLQETISTCRFAQRVAMIKNDVNLILEKDFESENALLRLENERLRQQIQALTNKNTSGDLTAAEKQTLESQIRRFLEFNTTISWDNDPRKVQFCFETFKTNFALSKDANSCFKKLEYYKDMVVQRDKEISLLIDMLKKERSNRDRTIKTEDNIDNNIKLSEGTANSEIIEAKSIVESGENNVHLAIRSIENSRNPIQPCSVRPNDSASSEILLKEIPVRDKDPVIDIESIFYGKQISQNLDKLPTVKQKRKSKRTTNQAKNCLNELQSNDTSDQRKQEENKMESDRTIIDIKSTESRPRYKKSQIYSENSGEQVSTSTIDSSRFNIASCNIVNLTLSEPSKSDVKAIKSREVNDNSDRSRQRSFRKIDRKQLKCAEFDINSEEVKMRYDNKQIDNETRDARIQNTKMQFNTSFKENAPKTVTSECSIETPVYYQRFLKFNVPQNSLKSMTVDENRKTDCYYNVQDDKSERHSVKGTQQSIQNCQNDCRIIGDPIVNDIPGDLGSKLGSSTVYNIEHDIELEKYCSDAKFYRNKENDLNKWTTNEQTRDHKLHSTRNQKSLKSDVPVVVENYRKSVSNDATEQQIQMEKFQRGNAKLYYPPGELHSGRDETFNDKYLKSDYMYSPINNANDRDEGKVEIDNINLRRNERPYSGTRIYDQSIENVERIEDKYCVSKYGDSQIRDRDKEIEVSNFSTENPRKPYITSDDVQIQREHEESLSMEKSLPLTGDPEIDEEIIAFYKAKRSGSTY